MSDNKSHVKDTFIRQCDLDFIAEIVDLILKDCEISKRKSYKITFGSGRHPENIYFSHENEVSRFIRDKLVAYLERKFVEIYSCAEDYIKATVI